MREPQTTCGLSQGHVVINFSAQSHLSESFVANLFIPTPSLLIHAQAAVFRPTVAFPVAWVGIKAALPSGAPQIAVST